MLVDILIVAAVVVCAYFAVRYLSRPRRRGCSSDCTKCGACRTGAWAVKPRSDGENGGENGGEN